MRLKERKAHVWNESYLSHHYLWKNIESAVAAAKAQGLASERLVLDIGCGNRPYADLFADCSYIGLNYGVEHALPDIVGDALKLPIASHSFDIVFCTQVIEHVKRPWVLVDECHRVLKAGGWLVLSAPFYWPLHEEPNDYFRFTRYGLESLMTQAGFSECKIYSDGGDQARLIMSVLHALPVWLGRILRVPLNLSGLALDRLIHRTTLPANYTVLARAV